MILVQELKRDENGRFIATTLNEGDVILSADDAHTVRVALERSDAELAPSIATLYPVFPVPEAIPVEIDGGA